MEGEYLSWLVIEPGWTVVTSDGQEVGHVQDVVGDRQADIFDGLSIASDLDEPRYVPSEKVGTIVEGRVDLQVTAAALEQLEKLVDPPATFEAPLWKRVVPWLRSLGSK